MTVAWEQQDQVGLNPVTGEAVVLDLRPASFVTRGLALLLDLFVLLVAEIAVSWLLIDVGVIDQAAGAAILLVATIGILVGLPVTVETLTRGKSLGKLAAGLRVVRDDGGPIRARHALIRGLLGFFEIYAASGSVAIIASLANSRGKRLGDLLAGTYVIRERVPPEPYVPLMMPPQLAGWATACDLGRIPDRLALAARQFIARSQALNPGTRAGLGADLAARIGTYVAPPPPGRPSAEEYLVAVLVERRRRDHERLARLAAARDAREYRRRTSSVLTDTGTALPRE